MLKPVSAVALEAAEARGTVCPISGSISCCVLVCPHATHWKPDEVFMLIVLFQTWESNTGVKNDRSLGFGGARL